MVHDNAFSNYTLLAETSCQHFKPFILYASALFVTVSAPVNSTFSLDSSVRIDLDHLATLMYIQSVLKPASGLSPECTNYYVARERCFKRRGCSHFLRHRSLGGKMHSQVVHFGISARKPSHSSFEGRTDKPTPQ
jgi:hypothetical protein